MLLECGDGLFGSVDVVDVGEDKVDVHLVGLDRASTALEHLLSITLRVGV